MKILVVPEELEHVVPADAEACAKASINPTRMYEELVAKNGGLAGNIERANRELKTLIDLAVDTAKEEAISLAEIQVVCPELMSFEGWSNYTEKLCEFSFNQKQFRAELRVWLATLHDANLRQLRNWFVMVHGTDFCFHIESAGGSVSISFSPRASPRHHFGCRYDY